MSKVNLNKKKKFVKDGVFHAEVNSFLGRALASAGYAGIEVKVTPVKTVIEIKASKIQDVVGVDGRKIKELTALIQKRFNYQKDGVELLVKKMNDTKALSAQIQAEACKFKLMSGAPVRMAANTIIRNAKQGGARGCEVIVSGKLRQQRAKTMKFKEGYMICTGQPKLDYVDVAVKHVFFKQGIIGVKVKIMMPFDATGIRGVKIPLPDNVVINDPKEDDDEEEIRVPRQGGEATN